MCEISLNRKEKAFVVGDWSKLNGCYLETHLLIISLQYSLLPGVLLIVALVYRRLAECIISVSTLSSMNSMHGNREKGRCRRKQELFNKQSTF